MYNIKKGFKLLTFTLNESIKRCHRCTCRKSFLHTLFDHLKRLQNKEIEEKVESVERKRALKNKHVEKSSHLFLWEGSSVLYTSITGKEKARRHHHHGGGREGIGQANKALTVGLLRPRAYCEKKKSPAGTGACFPVHKEVCG